MVVVLSLPFASCATHAEIPSACTAVSDDTIGDPWYQDLIVGALLPPGAIMITPLNPPGETVIRYRGRHYTFTTRHDGRNVCLDFHPPLPASQGEGRSRLSQMVDRIVSLFPQARAAPSIAAGRRQ